jgi:hypothetical protein
MLVLVRILVTLRLLELMGPLSFYVDRAELGSASVQLQGTADRGDRLKPKSRAERVCRHEYRRFRFY